MNGKYSKYVRMCPYEMVDVYRVLEIFNVTDPCFQHAAKKILLAGLRTGKKPLEQDIQEAIDSLTRWLMMRQEDDLIERQEESDECIKKEFP